MDGLVTLGTEPCIDALVGYLHLMEGLARFSKTERFIHGKLAEVAASRELQDMPAWNEDGVASEWRKWLKKNGSRFPRKLGKAKLGQRPLQRPMFHP